MTGDDLRHDVPVRPGLDALARSTTSLQSISSWIGIIFFMGMGTLFVALSLLSSYDPAGADGERGQALVAAAVFYTLAALAWWWRRRARALARSRLAGSRVALTITATTIEFPPIGRLVPAECWPLVETQTHCTPGRFGTLKFTSPGRAPRRLAQYGIAEPVEQVQERILTAQRRLAAGQG